VEGEEANRPMKVLLSRWQFGVTITYHFLFVPLTIGLALLVAVMQVLAYVKKDETWERLSRFFGTLFLINFAMGVVTGIVQEFQFGMNWSNYSVFVGNIFGAPLAMEGLLAFFAESTFIGLWLFGRNRLPALVHTLSICVVSLATIVSAFFILAANAWMQHPVGYRIVGNKAELADFWAVLRNSTLWAEFSHTVLAAFVTGAMVVLGVSGWQLLRGGNAVAFTRSARLAAWVALAGTVAVMFTGDIQARLMDSQQPMKMAAAEAVYRTQSGASFSLLTIGNLSGQPIFQIRIPHLLSLIATLSWNGRVDGVTSVQHAEALRYGPGSYVPVLWVTYWSFRLMVGLGFVMLIVSAWTLWRSRRGARRAFELGRFTLWLLVACIVTPFAANTFGWLFTEMGRQPWIVYGLMKTGTGISPSVSVTDVALTLGGFVLLYTVLGVIDIVLMYLAARRGLGPEEQPGPARQEPAGELIY
jgi:cytochrome d ubiquinol oxidase subunit I